MSDRKDRFKDDAPRIPRGRSDIHPNPQVTRELRAISARGTRRSATSTPANIATGAEQASSWQPSPNSHIGPIVQEPHNASNFGNSRKELLDVGATDGSSSHSEAGAKDPAVGNSGHATPSPSRASTDNLSTSPPFSEVAPFAFYGVTPSHTGPQAASTSNTLSIPVLSEKTESGRTLHDPSPAAASTPRESHSSRRLQADNSLLADTLETHLPYTSTCRMSKDVQLAIMAESRGRFVGPMDPQKFVDVFVPGPQHKTMPLNVSWKKVARAVNESDMYEHFLKICRTLDSDPDLGSHKMTYVNSSKTSDRRTVPPGDPKREGLKPDVMFYGPEAEFRPGNCLTDFARADGFGEFKFEAETYDPFCDKPQRGANYPFERITETGKEARGQIAAYASAIFELQFRTFCFSFLILGRKARFIRWDRSGAIVTKAFDYINRPGLLTQFFWRYGFLSPAQRGHDISVQRIPRNKILADPTLAVAVKALQDAMKDSNKEPDLNAFYLLRMSPLPVPPIEITTGSSSADACLPGSSLLGPPTSHVSSASQPIRIPSDQVISRSAPPSSVPLPKNHLSATDGSATGNSYDGWDHIVLPPQFRDRGPCGEASRLLYACERRSGKVRHLKDTWRAMSPGYTVEHEVIQELRNNNVKHIGTVHSAWDVAPSGECSDTVTPEYCDVVPSEFLPVSLEDQTARCPRRLYRLIIEEVGKELWKFEHTKELVQAVQDAIEAHDGAETAGWRHRNISVGSILIVDGGGILINWSSAKAIVDMNKGSMRDLEQEGTWQFVSSARLYKIRGPHERLDEMESFFWVLLWIALKFCKHSLPSDSLKNALTNIFDAMDIQSGVPTGGRAKQKILRSETLEHILETSFELSPLNSVLENMHDTLGPRYREPPDISTPQKLGVIPEIWERKLQMRIQQLDQYNLCMTQLRDSSYLRKRIQLCLDSLDWPTTHDGPRYHPIYIHNAVNIGEKRAVPRDMYWQSPAVAAHPPKEPMKQKIRPEGPPKKMSRTKSQQGRQHAERDEEEDGDELEHELDTGDEEAWHEPGVEIPPAEDDIGTPPHSEASEGASSPGGATTEIEAD